MEEKSCKYCLESEKEGLISPCICRGTLQWVHRSCLDKWRMTIPSESLHDHFYQCELCHKKYQFEEVKIHRSLWEKICPFLITLIEFLISSGILIGVCYGIGYWTVNSYHPLSLGDNIDKSPANVWLYGFIYVHIIIGILVIFFGVCIFVRVIYMRITGERDVNGIIFFIIAWIIGSIIFEVSVVIFFCFLLHKRYTTYLYKRDVSIWVVSDLSKGVTIVVTPQTRQYRQVP